MTGEWSVWDEAQAERERAVALHGDRSMDSYGPYEYPRLAILMEEVGEVAREFCNFEFLNGQMDATALRSELIQVAAMAGAWAEAIRDG